MKRKFVTRKAQGEEEGAEASLRVKDSTIPKLPNEHKIDNQETPQSTKGSFNTSLGIKKPLGKTSINTALSGKRVFNTKIGEAGIVSAVELAENIAPSAQIKFDLGSDFDCCAFDAKHQEQMGSALDESSKANLEKIRQSLRWKVLMPRKFF